MSITLTELLSQGLNKMLEPEGKAVPQEQVGASLQLMDDLMHWKIRLKDILKVPEDHIKALYTFAYDFYQKGNYKNAGNLFTLLTMYDPLCIKYWEGLGAAKKLTQDYSEALSAYFVLVQIKPAKMSYYLELAEIFIKMKQFEAAIQCCDGIESMAKDPLFKVPENADVEEHLKRAKLLKQIIQKNKGKE